MLPRDEDSATVYNMQIVLWDWNGTLIDDTASNVELFNRVMGELGYAPISIERFQEIYQHPIQKLYEQAGFDPQRHSFQEISKRWSELYHVSSKLAALHDDAYWVLETLHGSGTRQALLSALPHKLLEPAVERHGLTPFFEVVQGATDALGQGKVEQGAALAAQLGVYGREIALIGDSSHDAEVAQELGAACWLVSHGAESELRLLQTGFPVCRSLREAHQKIVEAQQANAQGSDASPNPRI